MKKATIILLILFAAPLLLTSCKTANPGLGNKKPHPGIGSEKSNPGIGDKKPNPGKP
ncbi:MAG: hypothetical protein V3W31_10520 [Thermodesulfobacteriota bacterium]